MKRIFVDTSFWVALFFKRDANHARAATLWRGLGSQPADFITSDYVFDETVTLLARRVDHPASLRAGAAIRGSVRVRLMPVFGSHFEKSWLEYERYSEGYSFTDVSSFVLMRALRIGSALSFDQDFSRAGFETVR